LVMVGAAMTEECSGCANHDNHVARDAGAQSHQ
jgi:hypothetical protein